MSADQLVVSSVATTVVHLAAMWADEWVETRGLLQAALWAVMKADYWVVWWDSPTVDTTAV